MAEDTPTFDVRARDLEVIENSRDPASRDAASCALAAFRMPDKLGVGDPMPEIGLARLDDARTVQLQDYLHEKPLVLIFGSYT